MSLIGLMFNKDGIVAFSESRSTAVDINGNLQIINDDTKKIIKHKYFLAGVYGTNTFLNDEGKLKRLLWTIIAAYTFGLTIIFIYKKQKNINR